MTRKTDGSLRQLLRKYLPGVHWVSIETGSTEQGVPDMNWCVGGAEGWIENKVTAGWKVAVRPHQVAWMERRTRSGGRVHLLVRAKGAGRDELWLLRPTAARALAAGSGLRELEPAMVLGRWPGGPARWPWHALIPLVQAS